MGLRMKGSFQAKEVKTNYEGAATITIGVHFYYQEHDEIYFGKLDTTLVKGEFCQTLIHVTPSIINSNTKLIDLQLNIYKEEVIQKLRFSFEDIVLNHMNKHRELHPYRIGWLVG
ncbi:glycerol kinase [Peribacillus deserti]|uniref:Glycerol kinase n=1 Tax=Peribacillus deserti TaxID=673318 RepID=A0ABS2QK38_9BACI|nr:glycerol kinase [Peribacillus deserti]